MIRNVDSPFGNIAEYWTKVLHASFHDIDGLPVWIVKLTVGKGQREVDGWVFMEPEYMEIRFEIYPKIAPPGFLSGIYLSQGVEESSLALLFDNPCEMEIDQMESNIRKFLNKCKFCVRTLTDIASGICWSEAAYYRFGCATVPIKRLKEITI